jgi:hypothetical protein
MNFFIKLKSKNKSIKNMIFLLSLLALHAYSTPDIEFFIYDKRFTTFIADGNNCTLSQSCLSGACSNNFCLLSDNAPCPINRFSCASGKCTDTNVCAIHDLAKCRENSECASGICSDHLCKISDGNPCVTLNLFSKSLQ